MHECVLKYNLVTFLVFGFPPYLTWHKNRDTKNHTEVKESNI